LLYKWNAETGHNKYIWICMLDCILLDNNKTKQDHRWTPYQAI